MEHLPRAQCVQCGQCQVGGADPVPGLPLAALPRTGEEESETATLAGGGVHGPGVHSSIRVYLAVLNPQHTPQCISST